MIDLLVERIVASRDFGTIFVGRRNTGEVVRVKALQGNMLGRPATGELWSVDGKVHHTQWGLQIAATRAVRIVPSGALIIKYLATCVAGIGVTRAQRLWRHFEDRLPEALDIGDVVGIASVMDPARPLLGPRLAAALIDEWKSLVSEARLVEWLSAVGVTDLALVRRLHMLLGPQAPQALQANPYCLVPLLDWNRTDELGRRLLAEGGHRAPESHPLRLVGAADAVMKDILANGSTAIGPQAFRHRLAAKLDVHASAPIIDQACNLALVHKAALTSIGGSWRAPGCAMMENDVVKCLHEMLASAPQINLFPHLESFDSQTIGLSTDQAEAVRKSLCSGFAIINGGAGTGKTHVMRTVCDLWERAGGQLLLATMSGKAALRLSRATGRLARTVFRTLRELDERQRIETQLPDCSLDEASREALIQRLNHLAIIASDSLVVLDEASMVDLSSLFGLIRRMPKGARLLLVGDERQLPPVSFGLTFHKFVEDPTITATLTTTHRQASYSSIPATAAAIRRRELPDLQTAIGPISNGVAMAQACGREEIADRLVALRGELAEDADVMIVTPTNEGPCGVVGLNRRLHERYQAKTGLQELRGPLGDLFSPGEPVLHLTNDYRRGLFNGSLGTVREINSTKGNLVATFDGEEHAFISEELVDLALGYALTAHRAQGSEADNVLIALPDSRLLDPSWLYTAVTRARRSAVLVGQEKTIVGALERPFAEAHRNVGLQWP